MILSNSGYWKIVYIIIELSKNERTNISVMNNKFSLLKEKKLTFKKN
jgi:hypothetical protein